MIRWIWILIAVAAVAATVACMHLGRVSDRTGAILRFAPGLAPAAARHLALDDDDAFRRYSRAAGPMVLKGAMGEIDAAIDTTSIEAFSSSWGSALPHLLRISTALAEVFQCPDYLRDYRFRAGLGLRPRWMLQRLMRASTAARTTAEKLAACDDLMARYRALGYQRGVMLCELGAAGLVMEQGRFDLRLQHLRRATWIARSLGETYMRCQILGELGSALEEWGQRDSMAICYEEALGIARRCHFADQAARIVSFYAGYHAREGRLGVATHLIMDAQRECRELGGGAAELRFLVGAMAFFSDLGCWEISQRLLLRAPALMREPGVADVVRLDLESQRARVLLASGQIEEAERVLRRIQGPARVSPARTRYAALLGVWGAGLVDAGRYAEALPIVDRGLAYCDSLHVPECASALALRRAQILHALGRIETASAALQDFDRRARASDEALAIEAMTLKARLLQERGDRAQARTTLRIALARLREHARHLDPGPQGYLALASFQDLRLAAHDLLASTPAAGYQVEREWRSIPGELGRSRRDSGPPGAPGRPGWRSLDDGTLQGAATDSRVPLPPEGTWHCVYLVRSEAIVRWTASAGGVRRDTLAITAEECARRVRTVVETMARARAGEPTPDPRALESDLNDLARRVLPDEVFASRAGAPAQALYVTPDGSLSRLPFEALNLSAGGYEALARRFDVVYVREAGEGGPRRAPGTPSILADPLLSREFRRRFPHADTLEAGSREADVVLAAWPAARLLRGPDATKHAVMEAWGRAPRIHVAAHLERDPEIPFIAFIPVAVPADAIASDQGDLELADVRSLDLRGCELVVLSGCASGAPYLSARRLGPSMGDGFLDAGAGAVVQTFWDIEDQEALSFVASFLHELRAGATDPVRALNAARRQALGSSGARHPEEWATWSVGLRCIPERATPAARLASRAGAGRALVAGPAPVR